jgi:metal-sulfur cluster biosynthetic enzyme
MGETLTQEVAEKIRAIPGVKDVHIELVWDPPWSRERMSEAARIETGLF